MCYVSIPALCLRFIVVHVVDDGGGAGCDAVITGHDTNIISNINTYINTITPITPIPTTQ